MTARTTQRPPLSPRAWIVTCLGVVLVGIAARVFIHTRSPITPAIDGAYYAIQPRSLLVSGKLDYPDMPVRFLLDAALARVLQSALDLGLDDACMRASQVTDCLLPPLVALPIFLLAASVSRTRCSLCTAAAAGTLLVIGGPALRMAADFQKNALALVFLAALLQQACRTLALWMPPAHAPMRSLACTGAWLALVMLTHVGTGAVAALNLVLISLGALACSPELRGAVLGRGGLAALAGCVVACSLALALLHWLDPIRVARIMATPARLLHGSQGGVLRQPAHPPMGGDWLPFIGTLATGSLCMFMLLRHATADGRWRRAAGFACAVTACLVTLPALNRDSSNRLALVAVVPAATSFVLAFASGPAGLRGTWAAWLVMLAAITSAPTGIRFASRPCIDPASLDELRALREHVPEHRRALLVARHGLEFWANQAIDVNTRQSGIPADAFDRYDRVLVLTEVRPFDPMPDEGRPPGPRGPRPPFGPPPTGGGPGPMPGSRAGPPVVRPPPGSRLVFEGRFYRLFEVPREAPIDESDDDAPLHG